MQIIKQLLLVLLPVMTLHAHEKLSPHQRMILESKSPPPIEATFRFDAPPGPQFTDVEKEAQRECGKGVMPMVMKAFDSGAGEVRISGVSVCQITSGNTRPMSS